MKSGIINLEFFRKEGTSMNKIDEILEIVKGNAAKKEEKKSCPIVWILAIVGAVVAVAAIAYAVYRYFSNAEAEEALEDEFDDDFDDDFFEDEESDSIIIPKQEPETAEVEETDADEVTEE